MSNKVIVIGAGLAGCEAAWTLAQNGVQIALKEMKPQKYSPAHTFEGFAELVCSNSLKAIRINSAAGLLKAEMQKLGSLSMECAIKTSVAAGGALAVDRQLFSEMITQRIKQHENITVEIGEVTEIPHENTIIATGPLTSDSLAASIEKLCGGYLSFFDAAAPIVTAESVDTEKTFMAARYGKGDDDYINCPFTKDEYEVFYEELVNAHSVSLKEFEQFNVYEGCMPVEVMAKRGVDTLRFGPLKPVGLTNPKTGKRAWAVVQLRAENVNRTSYNLVGFQTNLKFAEQKRVFSMIPGLENADFVRYGVMHRNTFINSPKLLTSSFRFKERENLYFAGQITGVEGYMESAASGLIAGHNMLRYLTKKEPIVPPITTMIGALCAYISDETVLNFQPMGSNMGILPSLPERIKDKSLRYEKLAERAMIYYDNWNNSVENGCG